MRGVRKAKLYGYVVIATILMANAAYGEGNGYAVGVKAGTLGLGADFAKSLSDDMDVRIDINSYTYTTTSKMREQGWVTGPIDYTDYNTSYNWRNTALLFDIYMSPHGTFHEVIGYLFSNNEIALNTPVGGAYNVNNVTGHLAAGEYLNGKIAFGGGPYIGFGWGNATEHAGFSMNFEIGMVRTGAPKVTLHTNIPGVSQGDIDKEEANVASNEPKFDWYPVMALGVSYGF